MKVFITGVSRGIGLALAKRILAEGHEVWGVSRTEKSLITDAKFIYSQCDITSETEVSTVARQMQDRDFLPDSVILNAGIEKPDLENGYDYKVGQEIFQTNFDGAMRWVDLFLRFEKKPSQFIALSSVFALRPNDLSISYSASKAALSMAFRGLRYQFDKSQVMFKIIYLVAVNTVIKPSYQVYITEKKPPFFVISPERAAQFISRTLSKRKENFYSHFFISLLIRMTLFLPDSIFKKLTDPFRR